MISIARAVGLLELSLGVALHFGNRFPGLVQIEKGSRLPLYTYYPVGKIAEKQSVGVSF